MTEGVDPIAGVEPPAMTRINVNGRVHDVHADAATPLLYILRNDLALNGPKFGCGLGECGACMVLIGDRATRACTVPLRAVGERMVTTLEGLAQDNKLHPVQVAFITENAAQCGYCLNGMIIAAVSLIARNPTPDDADIRAFLRHNLCRCGTHIEILRAVHLAVKLSQAAMSSDLAAMVPETKI
jgi:nicotinate dehydrogenase subunit A